MSNSNPSEPLITVKSVSKQYSSGKWGVKGLTFDLTSGIHGLVGPNGAGKTTTIKLLLGLLQPTSAKQLLVLGEKPTLENISLRKKIGFAHANQQFPRGYTGEEYLDFVMTLYEVPEEERDDRKSKFLSFFELEDSATRQIKGYSSGMKQKLALIQAFINPRARFIMLDEPTSNLDPVTRIKLVELVKSASKEQDISFLISSHSLLELEQTCTDYLLIHEGSVMWQGTRDELNGQALNDFYLTKLKEKGIFDEVKAKDLMKSSVTRENS